MGLSMGSEAQRKTQSKHKEIKNDNKELLRSKLFAVVFGLFQSVLLFVLLGGSPLSSAPRSSLSHNSSL